MVKGACSPVGAVCSCLFWRSAAWSFLNFVVWRMVNAIPSANSLLSWFSNLAAHQHHPQRGESASLEETGHLCFLSSTDDAELQPGSGTTALHQRSPTGSPRAKYTLQTYVHPTQYFNMFWICCRLLQISIFNLKTWSEGCPLWLWSIMSVVQHSLPSSYRASSQQAPSLRPRPYPASV